MNEVDKQKEKIRKQFMKLYNIQTYGNLHIFEQIRIMANLNKYINFLEDKCVYYKKRIERMNKKYV